MPAPKRKRLPSDFFDRLLSNQTDDQINDLLTSLVDEQIAPTAAAEEAAAPRKRAKEHHRDKIEDAIITRDESLEEEGTAPAEEGAPDELIPRTARMQADGRLTPPPPRPAPPVSRPAPPAPRPAEVPPVPAPPVGETPEPAVVTFEVPEVPPVPAPLPGLQDLQVPPELLNEPVSAHGVPIIDLTIPPAPPAAPPVVSTPPTEPHDVPVPSPAPPAAPVEAPRPESRPKPSGPRVPEPVRVSAPAPVPKPVLPALPTHEELRRERRKARWQKIERKPKAPKLAKPSPPVSFRVPVPGIQELAPLPAVRVRLGRIPRMALYFILPAFLAFSLFSWYPMLKGLFFSFLHYSPTGISTFAGLSNYVRAFNDPMFWSTLLHAGWFCVLVLVLGFWLPIFISIVLNELRWGKGLFKFIFFLPFLMPTVPAAILWQWIMDQGFGLLNATLAWAGLADPHVGWLTDPRLAMFSIALLYIWKSTGWAVLIYSAALTNLDETLYEEAEIDGATLWSKVWHVTLPSLRGVIGVMFLLTLINTLQIFTEVYILTQGGPMQSTEVIATYIYKQAFFYMDIGYASALSMVLLLLLLTMTLFRLRRFGPEGD